MNRPVGEVHSTDMTCSEGQGKGMANLRAASEWNRGVSNGIVQIREDTLWKRDAQS